MAIYFGPRIRDARKRANLTQKELADRLGVSNTSISNWEKNISRPGPDMISNICGILEIAPNELFGSVGNESRDAPSASSTIPPGFEPLPKMDQVPLIGSIACGEPITAEENIEGTVSVPTMWRADFALTCKGNSMEPTIKDGDVVAIRSQPAVENGQIAAVRIGGEATLKKVYAYPDRVELRPTNPECEMIVLYGDNINTAAIEGLAVGLCRGI